MHRTDSSAIRNGKRLSYDFYHLECDNWVNVIAMTVNGDVVLIEQYRAGVDGITLEIPGGTVDKTDASSKEAGLRELLEETGYISDELVFLGRNHTYLAMNARKHQEPVFDGTEAITLKEVPLNAVPALIRSEEITHALVIAAFHHLHLYQTRGE